MKLIAYCERLCAGKGIYAGDRINRMIELAGRPRGVEPVPRGAVASFPAMPQLIELAKKRMARPRDGLKIEVGRSYKDVNGEVRKVVEMPPLHRSCSVVWQSMTVTGCMRLEAFQEWALEEVK